MCEVTIGVASQCMVKPRQLNDQYLGNLALKINLKVILGGYNSPLSLQTADFLGTSTIIFGMDVSHPGSLGDVDSPSIAAVSISRIKQIVKKILGCVNCANLIRDVVKFI
jgi:eukaryotic translation initiation factor 2C